ncbi:NDxxF motif lipoprotein [Staphylococcus sp. Marseille-Q5304]|uniref:NDxxF motif lipoprotein n=1 Tax=Staphylococcus sp. Marseille-Q5304 TaxID=2942200 RepID=UPI002072C2BD|nr:NDxxF motif lipoprotein [Staphylococcus sp. Marseille-Q5304]
MKKIIIPALTIAFTVTLTACGNPGTNKDEQQPNKHEAPKNVDKVTENNIFHSTKKGKKLSEQEMNKAISKYLETNADILDNKYQIQYKLDKQSTSDKKITDAQAKRLSKLSHNAIKNDVRFKKFVKNNTLPEGYKENVDRIIKYFTALNSTIADADQEIEELDYQPQNKLNVVDVSTKYAGDVNGKQQDKIKKFLKSKNIDTKAIDK